MDFKEINAVGKMYTQSVPALLPWKLSDRRRLVYNASDGKLYYGGHTDWVEWPNTEAIVSHLALTNPHTDSLSTAELSAHTILINPHSDSLSSDALSAHINDSDNPHNTNMTLTDASSGAVLDSHMFAQEENCVLLSTSTSAASAGFINEYQLGQITYGLVNSSVDDHIEWKEWIRNESNEIVGFNYVYDVNTGSETLQYSMFGVVNRDIDTTDLIEHKTLYSTGYNDYSQLGLGDDVDRFVFTNTTIANVVQISASAWATHILKSDGTIWGTGRNSEGQLGLGNTDTPKSVFTQEVLGDTDWRFIDSGSGHLMAIKHDGTLWGTGSNNWAQLGMGNLDTTNRSTLTQVSSASDWETVSCGYDFTLGIKTDGSLWAWGHNHMSQLGLVYIGSKYYVPTEVSLGFKVSKVECGVYYSFIVSEDGELWGTGQKADLGFGWTGFGLYSEFTQIGSDTDWDRIEAAGNIWHTALNLAIKTDGSLWGMGENEYGQLGLGYEGGDGDTQEVESSWIQIGTDTDWIDMSIGNTWTAAQKSDGSLWGSGTYYEDEGHFGTGLHPGAYEYISTRIRMGTGLQVFGQFKCGDFSTFANMGKQVDHEVLHFGGHNNSNCFGVLPTGVYYREFTRHESPIMDVVKIGCGFDFTILLKSDGTLWSVGYNPYGELGVGYRNTSSPYYINEYTQEALHDTDWIDIWCGASHSIALKSNGTLWSTGYNWIGELGLGDRTRRHTFTQIGTATNWITCDGGHGTSYAINSDSELWGWGNNYHNELGQGYTENYYTTPQRMGTDTDWLAVSVGEQQSMFLKNDGRLYGVGYNGFGTLGIGNFTSDIDVLTQVHDTNGITGTEWKSVSLFMTTTMAIKFDGTLWATGFNSDHQCGIGDNGYTDLNVFTQVGTDTDWDRIEAGWYFMLIRKNDGTLWGTGWDYWGNFGRDYDRPPWNGELSTPHICGKDGAKFSSEFGCTLSGTLANKIV